MTTTKQARAGPGPLGAAAREGTMFHVEHPPGGRDRRAWCPPGSSRAGTSPRPLWRSSPARSGSRGSFSRSSSSRAARSSRSWRGSAAGGPRRWPGSSGCRSWSARRARTGTCSRSALVENLQREDLNPLEAAEAYARLREEFQLTQEKIAERVGKDRATVANTLRILKLPSSVREKIRDGSPFGRPREGPGRARLAGRPGACSPRRSCGGRSPCGRRRSASRAWRPATGSCTERRRDPFTRDAEEKLSRRLQTRVRIVRRRRGGQIEIAFRLRRRADRPLRATRRES